MNVQCPKCGLVQEFDLNYKICLKCGGAIDESHSRILENPRKGRGMQGSAIVAFVIFFFIFLFWSKFAGSNGMAISALVYIWGFYKTYLNKRGLNDKHAN